MANCIMETINEEFYDAEMCSLDYSVSPMVGGLSFEFSGYNEKVFRLGFLVSERRQFEQA